jgi:hypothetical protein
MRAHVRFALYRDVLQVLAQLDAPCAGGHEEFAQTTGELTTALATLATLTPACSRQRAVLLECLAELLARFGAEAPFDEAPEMQQAA